MALPGTRNETSTSFLAGWRAVTFYIVNANDTSEAFGYNSQYSTTAARNTFGYSSGRTSPLQGEVILRFRD